jgi:choline dehydrogenase
LKVRREGTKMR